MHVVRNVVPLYDETRAVAAEDGVRCVLHVAFRIVVSFREHAFRVVTRPVACGDAGETASAGGV